MADPIEDLLRACTVRVIGARPGAGFFVAPGVVLTCEHVVGAAAPLSIEWNDGDHPARLLGTVADRGRPIPSLASDYPDLALVGVEGLTGHPCVGVDEEWPHPEDRFQIYGYPEEGGSVVLTAAVLAYRGAKGSEPTVFLDLASDKVKPGMSGAPVLNLRSQAVCGMVVASKDVAAPDGALAVTWASMGEALTPHLVANRAHHQADPRWTDAAVRRPEARSAPGRRAVGERVSAVVRSWRDRDKLRHELRQALIGGDRIVSIVGPRGIGKSAVVANVLAEFEQADPARSPDLNGLAYLSGHTGSRELTLPRIYDTIARLAPPNVSADLRSRWDGAHSETARWDALSALWEALSDRSLVVVLDFLDRVQADTGELTSSDVTQFLTSACRSPYPPRVVTTSARRMRVEWEIDDHIKELPLYDGLPPQDALSLLRERDRDGMLISITDRDLVVAAGKLHFVPRGLELLSQFLARNPASIANIVGSDSAPSDLLEQLVSVCFDNLDADCQTVVSLLALAGVPLPQSAIPTILGDLTPAERVANAVASLRWDNQIGGDAHGSVRLPPLDADFLSLKLHASDPALHARLDLRLADWYASCRRPLEKWRVLDDATPSRHEYRHRWRVGNHDRALSVLAEAASFLARKGEGDLLRKAADAAQSVVASAQARIDLEYCRCNAEFFDGSLHAAEAALRAARAAAVAGQLGSEVMRMDMELGTVLRHRGELDDAVALLEPIVTSSREVSADTWFDAAFELAMSRCYLRDAAGARATAEAMHNESRSSGLGTTHLDARIGDVLALVALIEGDRSAALSAADASIAAYTDTPKQDNVGYLTNVKGVAHLQADDLTNAEPELRQALDLAANLGIVRLEGICATNLTWLFLRAGRWDEAREAAQRGANRLAQSGVDAQIVGHALGRLIREPAVEPALDISSELARAAAGADRIPDIYRPSDRVLVAIAAAIASQFVRTTDPAHERPSPEADPACTRSPLM